MPKNVVSINGDAIVGSDDDMFLHQETIEGTSVDKADLAKTELLNAYRVITSEGFRVMQEPFKARQALEKAQAYVLKAMAILIDPEDPANHKAIAHAASANLLLFDACYCLDSETTNKFIEDAYKAAGNALKRVSQAKDCLGRDD